jgi:hypothetical protein
MVRLGHTHLLAPFGRCCCCLETLASLCHTTKQRTLLCSNDNTKPYFNTILGQQDMVSVSAKFLAIYQTPAN